MDITIQITGKITEIEEILDFRDDEDNSTLSEQDEKDIVAYLADEIGSSINIEKVNINNRTYTVTNRSRHLVKLIKA